MTWDKLLGNAWSKLSIEQIAEIFSKKNESLGRIDADLLNEFGKYQWIEDESGDQDKLQAIFFVSVFTLLGYLAIQDGVVCSEEKKYASRFMDGLELEDRHKIIALHYFTLGTKSRYSDLEPLVTTLRNRLSRKRDLPRLFLEVLFSAAYVDGKACKKEQDVIVYIARCFNVNAYELNGIEKSAKAEQGIHSENKKQKIKESSSITYREALDILGVTESRDMATVRRAYRRMMSQYHPDKLISDGLPEEMIKVATEKTIRIRKAYEFLGKKLK